MEFIIQDHFDKSRDISWRAEKPFQGLRNDKGLPMTKNEAFIFNDMLKYKAYTNIEPMKTYLIRY